MATSIKSLSLIYTVAGSGVFNCVISFFLSVVTHPSLATVLHFILGFFVVFPPVSFSGLCTFLAASLGDLVCVCVSQALVSLYKITLFLGHAA